MASANSEDNPVAINVTAMVDVIFCLCLFFMCSFKFKQLEGRLDAWMPTEKGVRTETPKRPVVLEEIRIFVKSDASGGNLVRRVGRNAPVADDEGLMSQVLAMKSDYDRAGKAEVPLLIDATRDVNWEDVVHLIDLCKARRLEGVELVGPLEDSTPIRNP